MKAARHNIYFSAEDGSSDVEPWVTDETVACTHILRDIHPGKVISGAREFTYANGFVYFVDDDGTHDEIWVSDGTNINTVKVKEINPGNNPSSPCNLTSLNGDATTTATITLYFSQTDFNQYNKNDNLNSDLSMSAGNFVICIPYMA